MKKLAVLFMFFSSTVLAANPGPENLKNLSLCFRLTSVQVKPETAVLITNLQKDIFKKVSIKLKAYRIPYIEKCDTSKEQIFFQVDTTQAGNGTLVYSLDMNIFEYDLKPRHVSIYSLGTFGISAYRGDELGNKMIDAFSQMIDDFAADYATANP